VEKIVSSKAHLALPVNYTGQKPSHVRLARVLPPLEKLITRNIAARICVHLAQSRNAVIDRTDEIEDDTRRWFTLEERHSKSMGHSLTFQLAKY